MQLGQMLSTVEHLPEFLLPQTQRWGLFAG